jgi:ribosomal peptide maturation radical SAM protein 1
MKTFNYTTDLESLLRKGRALLIVPPFAPLDQPPLGVHVLQAYAKEAGFHVSILYANILLAATMGVKNYTAFSEPIRALQFVGERLFGRSAYGFSLFDNWTPTLSLSMFLEQAPVEQIEALSEVSVETFPFTEATLKQLEAMLPAWVAAVADGVTQLAFPIIGCTSVFEQTNACIALFKQIKRRQPQAITMIGGANCAGEMAQGIASLDPEGECIDYIFSGESEATFLRFLKAVFSGQLKSDRIIRGEPYQELDALPALDFGDYLEQLDYYLPDEQTPFWIPYEASRGCWWGQKRKCTFCSVRETIIQFRHKSPEQVLNDFNQLVQTHSSHRIKMVDNIMPPIYFRTLLPTLANRRDRLTMDGSQRPSLSLRNMLALKEAGFSAINVGIESLSSDLLRLMNKGVPARQQIAFLRYARLVGITLDWRMLWGFPGDTLDMYEKMLDLLPLIHHLQPPLKLYHLHILRFNSYFERPEMYGVRNIRPLPSYVAAFPPQSDIAKLATHFVAEYECASHQHLDVIEALAREITAWQERWETDGASSTALHVVPADERYLLFDTRGLPDTQAMQVLNHEQALVALTARPYVETPEIAWALENKIGVVLDGWYVPLATADAELLQTFEESIRRDRQDNPS